MALIFLIHAILGIPSKLVVTLLGVKVAKLGRGPYFPGPNPETFTASECFGRHIDSSLARVYIELRGLFAVGCFCIRITRGKV